MSIAKSACVNRSQKFLDNEQSGSHGWPEYCVPPVCQILLAARTFLADCRLYGLKVFRAGRMMLQEMHSFAKQRVSFAFETTLAGRSYLTFLSRLKTEGYAIHIFFLSLTSVDLVLSRIQERVSRGGHDVPEQIVRRRFDRSMRNFLEHYRPLADVWTLFDNSGKSPVTVALAKGGELRIINKRMHSELVNHYGHV